MYDDRYTRSNLLTLYCSKVSDMVSSVETTGNRQMELGYDIFCVGSGEHSPIFIFFPHTGDIKSQLNFTVSCRFKNFLENKVIVETLSKPKIQVFFPPSFFFFSFGFLPSVWFLFFFTVLFLCLGYHSHLTSTSLQFVNMYYIGSNSSVACSSLTSNKVCR